VAGGGEYRAPGHDEHSPVHAQSGHAPVATGTKTIILRPVKQYKIAKSTNIRRTGWSSLPRKRPGRFLAVMQADGHLFGSRGYIPSKQEIGPGLISILGVKSQWPFLKLWKLKRGRAESGGLATSSTKGSVRGAFAQADGDEGDRTAC